MARSATPAPWSQQGGATLFTRGEAQRFARQIVESETYRQTIKDRAAAKTLPPAIEAMLWYYAYGKPIEQVNLTVTPGQEDLSTLSVADLQARAKALADQLEEAEALENAIDMNASGTVTKGPW